MTEPDGAAPTEDVLEQQRPATPEEPDALPGQQPLETDPADVLDQSRDAEMDDPERG